MLYIYRKSQLYKTSSVKQILLDYRMIQINPLLAALYFLFFYNISINLGIILFLLFSDSPIHAGLLVLLYGLGLAVSYLIFSEKRRAMQWQIFNELPYMLNIVIYDLSAGLTPTQSVIKIASTYKGKLAFLFKQISGRIKMGAPFAQATPGILGNVNNIKISFFFHLLTSHTEIGGDLIASLKRFRHQLYEENKYMRTAKAIIASHNLSKYILTGVVILAFLYFIFIIPDYFNSLLDSSVGRICLYLSALLLILGYVLFSKLNGNITNEE